MQHETRLAKHMEKQLGWDLKLDGAESLGISKTDQIVSQVDEVSDMAPTCQLRGSVGGGP